MPWENSKNENFEKKFFGFEFLRLQVTSGTSFSKIDDQKFGGVYFRKNCSSINTHKFTKVYMKAHGST
jgi:hypothetical protein